MGALSFGLTAAVPVMAKADSFRGGDDHSRPAQVRVENRVNDQRHDDGGRVWDSRGGDTRDARNDRDVRNDRDNHDWRADRDRDDHAHVIVEHPIVVQRPIYVEPAPVIVTTPGCPPDADVDVQLCDVPANIMNTARDDSPGDITSIQFVRRDGHEFYRFMVSDHGIRFDMRVATNGHLLGVDRV